MFWENWPYWLKVGIIFGVIGLLWGLMGFTCDKMFVGNLDFSCLVFIVPSAYFTGGHVLDFISILLNFVLFFVIGTIVGLISDLFIKK